MKKIFILFKIILLSISFVYANSVQLEENPEMVASMKSLEDNKEVKALFDKITKEIEEKKKGGLAEQYAAVLVMGKYKNEIMKYREELEPLLRLMQK